MTQTRHVFVCMDCGARVDRRYRTDRSDICLDCAIARAEQMARSQNARADGRAWAKRNRRLAREAADGSERT